MASGTVPRDLPLDVIEAHVVRTSGVCGGRPRVKGTRITVWHVARWHEDEGRTVDEIVRTWPQLSRGDVFAALAYYADNRAAIEAEQAEAVSAVAPEAGRPG